jgi:DNA modification methylase
MGTLYYGDNLDILRRYLKDETVDLVYLDPPFNSAQNYNAFFSEKDGSAAASQIHAFEDTWHWDIETKKAYDAVTEQPGKVSDVMQAFYTFLGGNDMMAYLTMMSSRLVELRRVLKPTGSLYLHCDDTAAAYLQILLDAIFGQQNFKNQIIWQRTNAHNTADRYGRIHDVILFCTKTGSYTWNDVRTAYGDAQLKRYKKDDKGRLYTGQDLTASRPNSDSGKFEWRGTMPTQGRGWGYTLEQLEKWWAEGLILCKQDGTPRMDGLKVYLDEMPGKALQSVWTDIPRISNTSAERLGYPTQKPVALLERIIQASSNPGDLVLDPFCGCGTTIDAAEKLGRGWIGIDVTQLAISLIKNRLQDTYGSRMKFVSGTSSHRPVGTGSTPSPTSPPKDGDAVERVPTESLVRIIGEPTTPNEAATLAEEDKYQFQWWALGLVGARPVEQKKGADHGIDGKILFRDDPKAAKPEQIVIQVKGGKTGVKDVRDLRGVLDREKAAIGILISLQPATAPMETEAASAGFYEHKTNQQKFPRLQLRTVRELMEGKGIERPTSAAAIEETFKKAPQAKAKGHEQSALRL